MNFTGKLEGLKMDYATKKQSISVEVNKAVRRIELDNRGKILPGISYRN